MLNAGIDLYISIVYFRLIRKAQFIYYFQELLKCRKDIRKTWRVISSVLKHMSLPSCMPLSLVVDNKVVQFEFNGQEAFNLYIFNVGKQLLLLHAPFLLNLILNCMVV